jgi:hypothetical protein
VGVVLPCRMPWFTVAREVLSLAKDALPIVLEVIRAIKEQDDQRGAAHAALRGVVAREQASGEAASRAGRLAGPRR